MSERSITFSDLERSLDTNTDAEFAALAQSLPDDWTSVTPIGKTIRKQRLLTCIWGEYKDDESVLSFLKDILLAFPPELGCPAIFDTMNVESIADNRNTIWHSGVHSITHPNGLPHPLASQLTIFQIHEGLHYTTLIYDANGAHHYNSLTSTGLPSKVNHIRKRLNRYYSDRAATNPGENGTARLTDLTRTVPSMTTPSQTDGWTCAMHMLAVTLACTYQNSLPILTYSDQDVKNLHRFHLRDYVTGQLGTDTIDWLAGFTTLLQQPGRGTRDYTPPPVRPSAGGATLHRTYSETPAQDIFQGLTNWKRTTNKRKTPKESKTLTRKRELLVDTTTGTETYEPVPRNIRKSRRLLKEDTHTENTDTCTDTNISTNTTRGNQTRKNVRVLVRIRKLADPVLVLVPVRVPVLALELVLVLLVALELVKMARIKHGSAARHSYRLYAQ